MLTSLISDVKGQRERRSTPVYWCKTGYLSSVPDTRVRPNCRIKEERGVFLSPGTPVPSGDLRSRCSTHRTTVLQWGREPIRRQQPPYPRSSDRHGTRPGGGVGYDRGPEGTLDTPPPVWERGQRSLQNVGGRRTSSGRRNGATGVHRTRVVREPLRRRLKLT